MHKIKNIKGDVTVYCNDKRSQFVGLQENRVEFRANKGSVFLVCKNKEVARIIYELMGL